jgi:hypothetical protein
MAQFDNALNAVLSSMQVFDTDLCCAVYWDDICADNAIVMFMEYPKYRNMHAVMKELHAGLSSRLGHPVSICHNHPTDESVLIHSEANMASVYYSDECCKLSTIRCCLNFLEKREGYRPELQSIALAAECIAEGLNKTPSYVLNMLDWDQDPQAQLIKWLIDYHN